MTGSFAAAPPLTWSPLLAMSAHRHSADMAAGNFISHTGSDGSTPFTAHLGHWLHVLHGRRGTLPWGQPTVDAVMADWLSDYGHCANIMSPTTRTLYSLVIGTTGYRYYWTQDFGHP